MLSQIATWTLVIALLLSLVVWLGHLVWGMVTGRPWWVALIKDHTCASIGLPVVGMTAYLLVTVLEFQAGEIKIKGLSFEFQGAAGPIVLWIFVFLAATWGLWLTWKRASPP